MIYYKTIDGSKVVGISTINMDGFGNITASEYEYLKEIFRNKPIEKIIIDNGDGTYHYEDKPEEEFESTDVDKAEAYDIIVGEAT